jgi:predicted Ser/Thr protein kinase
MTDTEALVGGRYRIERALGAGGMGRVWLAYDELLRREVAIKEIVLPFGLPDDEREDLRRRTLREARAAARLSHPNVVRIYDVQSGDEQPWIVMEYVHSRSLLEVIQKQGALPVEQVAGIGLAVLSALDAANRVGVLHRDVKPSNVLIADDGRVVLTDFGSAMIDETDGAITRTGVILGSPQYIAPERVDTGVSTPEADLWSLGATLYAAVEGRPPYTRSTTLRSLIAITTDKPDPTRLAGPLKPVLVGLLQRNPEARMRPKEVEERLRRLADVQTTVRLRQVPQQRQPVVTASAAVPPRAHPVAAGTRPVRALPAVGRGAGTAPVRYAARARTRGQRGRLAVATALATLVFPLAAVSSSTDGISRPPAAVGPAALAPGEGGPEVFGGAPGSVPSTAPTAARTTSRPPFRLPDGFLWWRDVTGYRIAWPENWTHQRETPTVMFFCAPGGPPTLRITVSDGAAPDLLAALAEREDLDDMPGYRKLRMAAAPDSDLAAEWEYEFTDPKAGRLRGMERTFVAGGHTYVIQWRVAPARWEGSQKDLRVVLDSFRPATA